MNEDMSFCFRLTSQAAWRLSWWSPWGSPGWSATSAYGRGSSGLERFSSLLSIKFTFIRLVSTNYILTSTLVHKISSNILSFLDWLIAFFIRLTITATMWSDSAGIDPNTWSLCNLPANLNSLQLWNVVSENHLKDIRLLSKFHLLFFRDIFKTLSLISILSRKIKDYWWLFLDALPFLVSTGATNCSPRVTEFCKI